MFFVSSLLIDLRRPAPHYFMSKVLRHMDMLGAARPHFQLPLVSIHAGWGMPSTPWFGASISSPASSLELTYFFSYLNSPDVASACSLCIFSLVNVFTIKEFTFTAPSLHPWPCAWLLISAPSLSGWGLPWEILPTNPCWDFLKRHRKWKRDLLHAPLQHFLAHSQ